MNVMEVLQQKEREEQRVLTVIHVTNVEGPGL